MSARMIVSPDKLLPEAELRRLRIGSYEEKIGEAAAVARVLLGETPFQIVATRKNDAVVYADGKFLRVELREAGPAISELDVEVFESRGVRAYVEREARAIADLFLSGAVKRAVSRLENLVPRAAIDGQEDDPVAKIEAAMAAPRPWRRLFDARCDYITHFLGEVAGEVEYTRLHPKFGKLYDGSIEESNLINYEDRVAEELGTVLNRLKEARQGVETALTNVSETLAESAGTVFDTLGHFALDLLSDLRSLHEVSSHTVAAVDDISVRGKLCDTLVEGLYDREVASRFVIVAASKMVEAS